MSPQHIEQRKSWIASRRSKRKLARQARLRRQFLRYFFLVALLALGASGFLFLPWTIIDLDKDVQIHGNQVVTPEQIKSTLISCLGKPLYRLDPRQLQNQIQSLEDVRYAFVRRYLFPTPHLIVQILEEFPWASYCPDEHGQVTGVLSETGRFVPLSKFPNLYQPALKFYGEKALHLSSTEVAQWAQWINYINEESKQTVAYVDMTNATDIIVQTVVVSEAQTTEQETSAAETHKENSNKKGLRLRLGAADATLTKRLTRLASVLSVLPVAKGSDSRNLDYIDFRLESNIPLKLKSGGN